MSSVFPQTAKFRQTVEILNRIASDRLGIVLGRIAAKLAERNESFFNADEQLQLQSVLGLDQEEVNTAVEGSCFVFEHAGFTNMQKDELVQRLTEECQLNDGNAEVFGRVWESQGPGYIRYLRDKLSAMGPYILESTRWRLHLMMGNDSLTRQKDVSAIFEFDLARPAHQLSVSKAPKLPVPNTTVEPASDDYGESASFDSGFSQSKKSVTLEFSHAELYKFFGDLEKIQDQLDGLTVV